MSEAKRIYEGENSVWAWPDKAKQYLERGRNATDQRNLKLELNDYFVENFLEFCLAGGDCVSLSKGYERWGKRSS